MTTSEREQFEAYIRKMMPEDIFNTFREMREIIVKYLVTFMSVRRIETGLRGDTYENLRRIKRGWKYRIVNGKPKLISKEN